jgi:Zn-dependent membrane protease YugP
MLIILIVFMVIGFIVQSRLKRKFDRFSQVGLQNGMSGAEIAQKMLEDHGIYDVKITAVPGRLTDHYNPKDKTVNLSEAVYHERSVAAAAVAAHEVGHAVQHARAYRWLEFRSAMVPVVNFSSRAMTVIFLMMLFGGLVIHLFPLQTVFLAVIIMQAAITLFSLVTLPVEYDASNRALAWLNSSGLTIPQEHDMAKDALNSAANTYLVAALASLTQLAYYVLMFMGGDD